MDYKDMKPIGLVRLMLTDGVITVEQAAKYFPEFKESVDEKVKKELIAYLKTRKGYTEAIIDSWIAYLEKQGEQKSVVIPKFRVGDIIRPKNSDIEYLITDISDGYYRGKGWGLDIVAGDESNDYELVDKKPAKWSEKDSENLYHVNAIIQDSSLDVRRQEYLSNWLNSFKARIILQSQWKPTEMQLKCLKDACDVHFDLDGLDPLYTLYEQLKAL